MRDDDILKTAIGPMTVAEYRAHMMNPENAHKCTGCPENEGRGNSERCVLPCGQYNCEIAIAARRYR